MPNHWTARPLRRLGGVALAIGATTALLTGCGGGGGGGANGGAGGDAEYVSGGTFTMAFNADPGKLDPQSSAGTGLFSISQLAYDRLLAIDPEGQVVSGLASEWSLDGTTVEMTLAEGITCSDDSELTASDVKANLDYVGDPENASPFLGVFLPAGATVTADDAARTVTLELAAPAPFVLQGLANLPIVCKSGLDDRDALADSSLGTGPYELSEAQPGNQYTYTRREGYTWGPGGATTDEVGLPDTIVVRVIENESTAANLLTSGEINAAIVAGADAQRLEAQDLFSTQTQAIVGEQWYHHGDDHVTSDPAVRLALTQALDLEELQKVLTANRGGPPTTFAAIDPVGCPGDSVTPALPGQDVDAARAALEEAGVSKITFVYNTAVAGSGSAAAAELAVQQWEEVGLEVEARPEGSAAIQETVFGTGDWDVAWLPLNVNYPDQLVPFLSGTTAPDGTNFAEIENADYEAGVAEASKLPAEEGCATWLEAEANLVEDADVFPFANSLVKTFGNGAEFEYPGQFVPTSIRMLAK
ncbi:ABC transporter substrate-binding protein [Nocardioides marinquilinus]|uniref:ABC transporter substrate-binding protein n=1 Tax=Nocardioides marinquilinus TaxID=1210400 RepID=A0ABP9PBK7_9ACTN